MSYKVTFDQKRRTLPWKLDIPANVVGRRLRYFYPTEGHAWSDDAPRILKKLQNGGLHGLEENDGPSVDGGCENLHSAFPQQIQIPPREAEEGVRLVGAGFALSAEGGDAESAES
jgi:hypothetical protein